MFTNQIFYNIGILEKKLGITFLHIFNRFSHFYNVKKPLGWDRGGAFKASLTCKRCQLKLLQEEIRHKKSDHFRVSSQSLKASVTYKQCQLKLLQEEIRHKKSDNFRVSSQSVKVCLTNK